MAAGAQPGKAHGPESKGARDASPYGPDDLGRRVLLTWQVLIAAAARRETLTYSKVASRIGLPGAGAASTGKPSQVPDGVEDVDYARELVFRHPWPATAPPVVA